MQFVLTDLVNQSTAGDVTFTAYQAAGGVTGALSRRATEVYVGLDDADRLVAEQMFLRLVTGSEEADDVRRRVRRSELEGLGLDAGAVDRVLSRFGNARLLTFDRDPITRRRRSKWRMKRCSGSGESCAAGSRDVASLCSSNAGSMGTWRSGLMPASLPTDFRPVAGSPSSRSGKPIHSPPYHRRDPLPSAGARPATHPSGFQTATAHGDHRRIRGGGLIASMLAFSAFRSEDLAEAREVVLEAVPGRRRRPGAECPSGVDCPGFVPSGRRQPATGSSCIAKRDSPGQDHLP